MPTFLRLFRTLKSPKMYECINVRKNFIERHRMDSNGFNLESASRVKKENKTQKFVCKYEGKMYLFRFLYLAQIYNVAILTL